MSSLSFDAQDTNSIPLASVKGGSQNKKTLYINHSAYANTNGSTIDFEKYRKLLIGYKPAEKNDVLEYFKRAYKDGKTDLPTKDAKLQSIYQDILEKNKEVKGHPIVKLPPGSSFVPIPKDVEKQVNLWYIYGPAGVGKSTWSAMICKQYHKQHPKNDIYLISKSPDIDPALDEPYITKLDINTFRDIPYDLNEFSQSMILFDDYDMVEEKKLSNALYELINDVASMGRKKGISAIFSSHRSTAYTKTRLLLSECQYFVCFMHNCSFYQLRYLMKNYGNVDTKQLEYLKKLPSRWVLTSKTYPLYYLSEFEAGIFE